MARHNGSSGTLGSSLAGFAGGMLVGMLAGRLLPPVVAQATGMARGGGDALDGLIADHHRFLDLAERMQDARSPLQRSQLLLRLKRGLAAHAMAEEDAVYPALWDQDGSEAAVQQLYQEHAEIKHHLYRLEMALREDGAWRQQSHELAELLERHAHKEEEEEFPKLRQRLDERAQRLLGGAVQREKALIA
jgi:hemerythrin superfamily protein